MVHLTVSPTEIETFCGENAKFEIVTDTVEGGMVVGGGTVVVVVDVAVVVDVVVVADVVVVVAPSGGIAEVVVMPEDDVVTVAPVAVVVVEPEVDSSGSSSP